MDEIAGERPYAAVRAGTVKHLVFADAVAVRLPVAALV